MKIFNIVRKNTYFDSVSLMLISKQLKKLEGLEAVSVMMGTPANRVILQEADLLNAEGESAGANDLILAFRAPEETDANEICQKIDEQMSQKVAADKTNDAPVIRSSLKAYQDNPDVNLAVISVPGEYAALETCRALQHGKNVFLFSDNVSLEEEAELKKLAREKGLLVMGPDCGTAIINGVGIGFANRVRPGNVGLVAASGTGLQEVSCLLDAVGLGVSQAIGTGGRDLKEAIGAITMLQGLEYLLADPATETIILISKPPAPNVAEMIIGKVSSSAKKIILCFIGYEGEGPAKDVLVAKTLEEAALAAARVNGIEPAIATAKEELSAWTKQAAGAFSPSQRYIRALYAGGTLCYEAMLVMGQVLGPIYSNTPLVKELTTSECVLDGCHTAIDLGDDEFTKGRPHPMIDGSLRYEYITKVAADPTTAVLLLDVVIGFGASADPAEELVPVLKEAKALAKAAGNTLAIVAYVCGTDGDEQNKSRQVAKLEAAGVFVTKTNAEAARLASALVLQKGDKK